MSEELKKRQLILNLSVNDLVKTISIIDGKNNNYNNGDITNLDTISFLDLETKIINDLKKRLEDIFKE